MQSRVERSLKNLRELTYRERLVLSVIRRGSLGDVLSFLTPSAKSSGKAVQVAGEAAVVSKN
jgi:hypothetical protein